MRLILACLFVSSWIAFHAGAATLEGVTLPDTYTVDGKTLVLNGIGLRTLTIFEVKIYVAALYLPKPSHDAQQIMASPGPKVMLLHILHSGSKEEVEKEYRVGEKVNCGDGGCNPADAPDFERLVAAAPAIKVGDTLTYIFTDRGVRFMSNDHLVGDFTNQDIAHLLLAGFIGAHPPSESLRAHLLGLEQD